MTGLFRSKKYDDISYHIDRFWEDARNGSLANVVFVDPDYTDAAEDNGTSNDYHHKGSVLVAEEFVARVYNALKDESAMGPHGVRAQLRRARRFLRPRAAARSAGRYGAGRRRAVSRTSSGWASAFPRSRWGPFAPKKIEKAGPYEHCSILKMIEWRWGLEPLTLRDRYAKNLADALDFGARRDPIKLPPFKAPPALTGPACNAPT